MRRTKGYVWHGGADAFLDHESGAEEGGANDGEPDSEAGLA